MGIQCACRPAQGLAWVWVWVWASSEGKGVGVGLQHGHVWKGMGMCVGTQCEFEGVGVDREGEGEEHGRKLGVGVSIEAWCLGEGKGVWWARACGGRRHVVGEGERGGASEGLMRGEVGCVVLCFNLEFLGDWNGRTGAARVSHANQLVFESSVQFQFCTQKVQNWNWNWFYNFLKPLELELELPVPVFYSA
ncbi:hypothetical protein DFH94DRAFT_827458 [Russula ochroleuca]|uniref:Uncharacterized protein n=1 Tax=Russula ochroleuca TaxID=152965 RepID=A0A9P5MKE7_9AGAM|nr:hypothetical protein DFH94DRAFT_827458 [Russula ochroleuca]